MLYVETTFTITEFNNLTKNPDHHLIILFFLIDLICHKGDQPSLLRIKFNGIEDTAKDNLCIKWSANIIRDTHIIRSLDIHFRVITGNHDNRNIFNEMIPVHLYQHFKTIQFRHIDI